MKDDHFLTEQEISELRADAKKASELARLLFKEATKFENLEEKNILPIKKINKK